MGLVHVVASIGGGLLVVACGAVGSSIERFETGEECACSYVQLGSVLLRRCLRDELSEGVQGIVRTGWEGTLVVGH